MSASTTIGRSVARAHAAHALDDLRAADQPDVRQAEVVRGGRVAAVVERLDAGPLRDPRGEAVVRAEGDDRAGLGEAGAKAGRHADPPVGAWPKSKGWIGPRCVPEPRALGLGGGLVDGAPVDDDAVLAKRRPRARRGRGARRGARAAGRARAGRPSRRRPRCGRRACRRRSTGTWSIFDGSSTTSPDARIERLRAAAAVAPAVDPPRRDRRAVVVDRERAGPGEHVRLLDPRAAAVEARAAGVARRDVARDPHRVVALGVLRGRRPEERPPRVPVEPVGLVPGREPAEEELDELEVLARRRRTRRRRRTGSSRSPPPSRARAPSGRARRSCSRRGACGRSAGSTAAPGTSGSAATPPGASPRRRRRARR